MEERREGCVQPCISQACCVRRTQLFVPRTSAFQNQNMHEYAMPHHMLLTWQSTVNDSHAIHVHVHVPFIGIYIAIKPRASHTNSIEEKQVTILHLPLPTGPKVALQTWGRGGREGGREGCVQPYISQACHVHTYSCLLPLGTLIFQKKHDCVSQCHYTTYTTCCLLDSLLSIKLFVHVHISIDCLASNYPPPILICTCTYLHNATYVHVYACVFNRYFCYYVYRVCLCINSLVIKPFIVFAS